MIKLFWEILKNEKGIAPIALGSTILGGGALLGGIFGKKKEKVYDPYAEFRKPYMKKLGEYKPEEYKYKSEFGLDQPKAETAAEKTILGKLENLPTMQQDILGANEKYYQARKARMGIRHEEEIKDVQNMYNRLGLVSSTPGLEAQTKLGRTQQAEFGELEAGLMREGIDQEMKARALAEEIASMYVQQGQVLGQSQRGYQQYGQEMSMKDIQRMEQAGLSREQIMGSILGGSAPTVTYEPNMASRLGTLGVNIGGQMMGAGMLGGKKTTKKPGMVGDTGLTMSEILGFNTRQWR